MANIDKRDFDDYRRQLISILHWQELEGEVLVGEDGIRINVIGIGFGVSDDLDASLQGLLNVSDAKAEAFALKIEIKLPGEEKLRTYSYVK